MDVQISWIAVTAATIASMIIGSVWYARPVFGNAWIKLARVDVDKERSVVLPLLTALVAGFATAFVLALFTYIAHEFFDNSLLVDALTTGFWLWVGVVALRFAMHDGFEGRPFKLTLITVGHEFVTIMTIALIIGLVRP